MSLRINLAIALAIFCVATCLAETAFALPRHIAVVVGANSGAPFQGKLRHAARDARKMAAVLRELGGVAPTDLNLLGDNPTATEVLAALDWAEDLASRIQRSGTPVALHFYYSGHATPSGLQLSGTQLPIKRLRARLKNSKATVRIAILDACHAGVATRIKGGNRTRKKRSVAFSHAGKLAEGYAILTSSSASERSQESDEILGSFFTHHLVSALRGAADADRNGVVTLAEAYRYSYERTLRATARHNISPQHPNFDMALKGAQDVVLTRIRKSSAVLEVQAGKGRAQWVIFEPDSGVVIAEVEERPGRRSRIAVPRAEFDVYRRTAGGVARGSVDTRNQSVTLLSAAKLQPVPVTAYLYKGELGLRLSALVGIQTFAAQKMNADYIGAAPLISLGLSYQGVFHHALGASLDLSFTHSSEEMDLMQDKYTQHVTRFQTGLSLPWRFDFGSFSIASGPRVAFLYVVRRKEVQGATVGTDQVPMWAVGGMMRLAWRMRAMPLSFGIEGRLAYVPVPTEEHGRRDEMLVETQVAAGFHF